MNNEHDFIQGLKKTSMSHSSIIRILKVKLFFLRFSVLDPWMFVPLGIFLAGVLLYAVILDYRNSGRLMGVFLLLIPIFLIWSSFKGRKQSIARKVIIENEIQRYTELIDSNSNSPNKPTGKLNDK